jgi:FkbH-like protein
MYAEPPRRADLLALSTPWPTQDVRMQVVRNQAFEFVASALRPFLAFAGLTATLQYSDYDDSLSVPIDPRADVVLVWLDFERYGRLAPAELAVWLELRLQSMRAKTKAPILIGNHPGSSGESAELNRLLEKIADRLAGVHLADQAAIASSLGPGYRDDRTARLAATSLSDLALLHTARLMGLSWLPALLLPSIKAVAVDLDGTLYGGVLGEDGAKGLVASPEYLAVQQRLLALRENGIFLAAVSRNEPADVEALFRHRSDFAIRQDHFSVMAVSWGPKADAIRQVAKELRIGEDAILFIDDNPGELAAVASAIPNVRTLHAATPVLTGRALQAFPGLFRWSRSEADTLRIRDLAAAATREHNIKTAQDPNAYLQVLQVELGIGVDLRSQLERLTELSQKTNQFNTGLRRFGAAEVSRYIQEPHCHALSISLRDRLSDSGVVAAIFLRVDGEHAVVDEVAISCRALGRQLERLMIFAGIHRALAGKKVSSLSFGFTPGPRNDPARAWLISLDASANGAEVVTIPWHADEVRRELAAAPLRLTELGP